MTTPGPRDAEVLLERALAKIQLEQERLRIEPRAYGVEVDGSSLATVPLSGELSCVPLPPEASEVVLRDHLGTSRVRLELARGPLEDCALDGGRVRLSLQPGSAGEGWELRVRPLARRPLLHAAPAEDTGELEVGYTRHGWPHVSGGELVLEAFTHPLLEGAEVSVAAQGLGEWTQRVGSQGVLRVLVPVSPEAPEGPLPPGALTVRLVPVSPRPDPP